jgi:hypothetical protein
MPESFNLSLGGIPIALVPDRSAGEYAYVKRAIDFCSPAAPEATLQVRCGWFPQLDDRQIHFETGHAWQLLQVDGRWVIDVRSPEQGLYQVGAFPPDFRVGEIHVANVKPAGAAPEYIFPLSYPMGELYMMNLLGTGMGMLLLACGVIVGGQGYLFAGHGGAGKTTTARMWQGQAGVQVVNDDKVIVRKEGGQFRLYGTPWHGDGGMALPDSAPLVRLFILKQAAQNYAAPLAPVQAAAGLLARAFVPLWDPEKIAFSLAFLDELCQAVPCQELGFLPEPSAVDFVRELPREFPI